MFQVITRVVFTGETPGSNINSSCSITCSSRQFHYLFVRSICLSSRRATFRYCKLSVLACTQAVIQALHIHVRNSATFTLERRSQQISFHLQYDDDKLQSEDAFR